MKNTLKTVEMFLLSISALWTNHTTPQKDLTDSFNAALNWILSVWSFKKKRKMRLHSISFEIKIHAFVSASIENVMVIYAIVCIFSTLFYNSFFYVSFFVNASDIFPSSYFHNIKEHCMSFPNFISFFL